MKRCSGGNFRSRLREYIEDEDRLDPDEQWNLSSDYLSKVKKCINRVPRNGLCILESFKVSLNAIGNQVTIDALKDLLRKEVTDNYSFYSNFSEDCTNVIEEIERFISNPVKHYASDTADLIFQALARALSIKGTVFKINSDGLVSEFDVGVDASQSDLKCCFARTDVCHVDPVLDLIDIPTGSEGSYEIAPVDNCIELSDDECHSNSEYISKNGDTEKKSLYEKNDFLKTPGAIIKEIKKYQKFQYRSPQRVPKESSDSTFSRNEEDFDFYQRTDPKHSYICNILKNNEHTINYSSPSTEKLLEIVLLTPEKLEEVSPLKGIRSNRLYTIKDVTVDDINSNDDGAYINPGSTKKSYHVRINGNNSVNTKEVHHLSGQFYRKERKGRGYTDTLVPLNDVYTVERYYRRNKSIPNLKQLVVKVKHESTKLREKYICVIYSFKPDENVEVEYDSDVRILPHGNSKRNSETARPYIKTAKRVLQEEDLLLQNRVSVATAYETVLNDSGGPLHSSSQSMEPRSIKQIYDRKSALNVKEKCNLTAINSDTSDDLLNILNAQKKHDFIDSVIVKNNAYYVVLKTDTQIKDIVKFCCVEQNASVLGIDTTFNLCDMWLTDTCYRNKRLINPRTNAHPVFLGPILIHFTKEEETFLRFALELLSADPTLRNLKKIGVDLESAIYNGFKKVFPTLYRLLCIRHISERDRQKLGKLLELIKMSEGQRNKAKAEILKDLYGERKGNSYEYGLAEAFNEMDLLNKLSSLEARWNSLCPGFYNWFKQKRQTLFATTVVQSAREGTDVSGLFYQNDIESQHFVEKKKQSFSKLSVVDVIVSLEEMVNRQDQEEVRALYGAGSYEISKEYRRFLVDSARWHSWPPQRREQHLSTFRKFEPSIGDSFKMPKNAGRKPGYQSRERHKESPDIIIDRLSASTPSVPTVTPSASEEEVTGNVATEEVRFPDPRDSTPEVFELHFRKNLPRQITKCQGMCGKKITPDDNGLLVRTYGTTTWTERGSGREMSKYGPMYIHFSCRCLKAFDSKNYYGVNDTFDYQRIIVEKNVQVELRNGEREMLLKLGVKFV